MLGKFRLLLTTPVIAILLIACGSETDNALVDESASDNVEIQAAESEATNDEDNTDAEDSTTTTTSSAEDDSDEEVAEEATTEETEDAEEDTSKAPDHSAKEVVEAADAIDPLNQTVIDQILAVTGYDIEEHVFSFENTEDYVEVEIYEKTEDEHTPRVGTYRYLLDTEEVLVNDYLTGEFIPYEDLEQ